jgi:hypothetical protein
VVGIADQGQVEAQHLLGMHGTVKRPPKLLHLGEMMIGDRQPRHQEQHRDQGNLKLIYYLKIKYFMKQLFLLICSDGRRSSRQGGRSPRQMEMGDATPLYDE